MGIRPGIEIMSLSYLRFVYTLTPISAGVSATLLRLL